MTHILSRNQYKHIVSLGNYAQCTVVLVAVVSADAKLKQYFPKCCQPLHTVVCTAILYVTFGHTSVWHRKLCRLQCFHVRMFYIHFSHLFLGVVKSTLPTPVLNYVYLWVRGALQKYASACSAVFVSQPVHHCHTFKLRVNSKPKHNIMYNKMHKDKEPVNHLLLSQWLMTLEPSRSQRGVESDKVQSFCWHVFFYLTVQDIIKDWHKVQQKWWQNLLLWPQHVSLWATVDVIRKTCDWVVWSEQKAKDSGTDFLLEAVAVCHNCW